MIALVIRRATVLAGLLLIAVPLVRPGTDVSHATRLQDVQRQIQRLRLDLQRLERDRTGVLGELSRLEAEARLRDAELTRLELELGVIQRGLDAERVRVQALEVEVDRRRVHLATRLEGLYRQGPLGHLRLLLSVDEPGRLLDAVRLVRTTALRDARALAAFRSAREERRAAERKLEERQRALRAGESETATIRRVLARTLVERRRLLRRIDRDAEVRKGALEELLAAEKALSDIVGGMRSTGLVGPRLDLGKFRGLLDWPVSGRLSVPFGDQQHPRFRTTVPHPGVDFEALQGADIRAVFEGEVVFAEWFRGYGLTLILDHGGGYMSVYAHASVILSEKGSRVRRGQVVAKVGDTGSLKGPYLYFQIRKDGQPEDPMTWLLPAP